MNSAAGTTSRSDLSNGSRASAALAVAAAMLFRRVDENPCCGHVDPHRFTQRRLTRRGNVNAPAGGFPVRNKGIAASVFDVRYGTREHVDATHIVDELRLVRAN